MVNCDTSSDQDRDKRKMSGVHGKTKTVKTDRGDAEAKMQVETFVSVGGKVNVLASSNSDSALNKRNVGKPQHVRAAQKNVAAASQFGQVRKEILRRKTEIAKANYSSLTQNEKQTDNMKNRRKNASSKSVTYSADTPPQRRTERFRGARRTSDTAVSDYRNRADSNEMSKSGVLQDKWKSKQAEQSDVTIPFHHRSVVHVSGGSVSASDVNKTSSTSKYCNVVTSQPRASIPPPRGNDLLSDNNVPLKSELQALTSIGYTASGYTLSDIQERDPLTLTEIMKTGLKDFFHLLHMPFKCCSRMNEEPRRIKHKFRFYQFLRPRICFFCKQPIYHLGSACTAMLKFVATKPPRLKDGHYVGQGQGHDKHMVGQSTGVEYSFPTSSYSGTVDSDSNMYSKMRGVPNRVPNQVERNEHSYGHMSGLPNNMDRNVHSFNQMRGLSRDKENVYRPTEHWHAYNKRYGKVGLEKEISFPIQKPYVTPDNQHTKFDANYNPVQSNDIGLDVRIQGNNIGPDVRKPDRFSHDEANIRHADADDIRNANVVNVLPHGYRANMPPDSGGQGRGHGGQFGVLRPHSFSPESATHRQHQLVNGSMQSPSRFSHPAPYTSGAYASHGTYGPPYNLDSTGSMSIDSMSTSEDRSSKSISEYMDYDGVDASTAMDIRQRLELKPSLVSDKHKHVHIGRGTHGLCESPATSPTRPGTTAGTSEYHTSSLRRKSPSFRTGHHVTWDPGVVNSKQDGKQTNKEPGKPELYPKKKKRTSLRSLLNLQKYPASDDETTDHSDSGQQNLKRKHSHDAEQMQGPNATPELASLRYRTELDQKEAPNLNQISNEAMGVGPKAAVTGSDFERYSSVMQSDYGLKQRKPVADHERGRDEIDFVTGMKVLDYENNIIAKPSVNVNVTSHVTGLYVTRASDQTYNSVPYSYDMQGNVLGQHEGISKETRSISQPVMHAGFYSKPKVFQNKDALFNPDLIQTRNINSVQPYIINGQQKEEDYDNYLKTDSISVTKGNIFSSSHLTNDVSYGTVKSDTNLGQNTSVPVTFDTFVTFGGPSMSNVTFDRFVTLGRPYATSTPIPNGTTSWRLDQDRYKNSKEGERGLESLSGPFQTKVTQSWKYGKPAGPSVPVVTHAMYGSKEPVMTSQRDGHGASQVTKSVVSHDRHVTNTQQEGPYLMQNNEYGKLSSPPTTFYTFFGGPPMETHGFTNQAQGMSQDLSESETVMSKFTDSGTYSQKDVQDYDDGLFSEMLGLDHAKSARKKLVYEEPPSKVMTSCVPQLNHELNHDQLDHSGYPRIQVVPGVTQRNGMSNLNEIIMRSPDQGGGGVEQLGDHILDLVYITERIISMSFASEEHETTYKYNLKEVTRMLKTKHADNYMVINISDKRADLAKHCPQVLDYGWPDHLAPPLERLCSICKAIDSWLGKDINHVVVVHCKGGRGRIAVVIAAYMRYSNICASADQALDRFAMKRFYDDKLGGLPQPSQRRYVHYFAGLLSGAIQINSSALYLHHILIHGVPNFDTKGGCRPFIKVYQGMHPIFTSGVYNVTDNMQKVCISISPGIPLRGDILIKCYHKKNKAGQREIMWGCQFHTCAISHNSLVFSKNELDGAITDPRFPENGKVEFVFGNNSEGLVQVSDFKSDVTVPVDDSTDALTRWDSYENFGKVGEGKDIDYNANGLPNSDGSGSFRVTQLDHSHGPVDGSLYAQVNKHKLESSRTVIQNGPTKLQNGGSYTSSVDSGISAFSVPMGSSTVKSNESWSYNTRDREFNQPSFSSSHTQKSYSTSSASPRSAKALDEQTQLDQILSDLLNEQAFVSQKSPSGQAYSAETRSFKTIEDHISPEGIRVVQRGDVTYRMPEMKEEKHFTVKTQTKTMSEDEKSYKPVNAFTYTPPSPEMARSFEPIRSPRSPGSPRAGTLPYKVDYENKYSKNESYSRTANGPASLSDGEHSLSWLQQQQAKLREKSLERDPQRVHKEKMMIDELKTAQAQNKYFARRAQSEDEADLSYKKTSELQNGPTSPYSYTVSRTHTYSNSDKAGSDSVFRPENIPLSESHTTYIRQQYMSDDGKVSNKPPPSPSLQRTIMPVVSSPAPPPQRTSSKDYMQQQNRYRSNSGSTYQAQTQNNSSASSSWQTQTQSQARPLQRHYSESAYDRDHYERQNAQRSLSVTTPPLSPRSVSPQTYQTYKTIYKTVHHRKEDEPDSQPIVPQPIEVKVERHTESKQQMVQPPKPSSHYITEVYVQRSGGDSKNSTLDRKDSDKRLEALEKSLQAASASIIATQPWQQKESKSEEIRRFETRSYETKQEQFHQEAVNQAHSEAPAPKKIEVTEEDRITLKPIGPGVQQLEPEGSHTGTLGRESTTSTLGRTTPSFPTPVVSAEEYIQAVHNKARRMSLGSTSDLHATPPFPTTPKTPYQNVSVSESPYATINHHKRLASASSYTPATPITPNSVFEPATPSSAVERERDYNAIVSRQLMRTNDPLYASIPEDIGGKSEESQKMQYQTFNTQQQYQTNTLPHQTSVPIQPYTTQTLPLQSSLSQQQQIQQQQQQQQQQQYQISKQEKSFQSQQYHTQQYSSQDGGSVQGLQVQTDPRMLASQQFRSPSSPGSPPSPGSNLNTLRQQLNMAHSMSGSAVSPGAHSATGQSSPSVYFGMSRRGSLTSLDSEAVHTTPRFVKDTSKYWYKPKITREEAIVMLKEKAPGTFVVRDSNSFPGAFGLALKVAMIPPNVQVKSSGDPQADLVRHFLIEPTPKGVRLRGCSNEPVFGSLAALVYQHSITPLALPCKLVLPEHDPAHIVGEISPEISSPTMEMPSSASALLAQGAACNVIFLNTVDTESLTGPQAVARACKVTFDNPPPKTTVVHFKVSNQGITLTDNQRKLFFRRHYPVAAVTYCGMDPEDRKWKREDTGAQADAKVFGFVARKQGGISDNSCHLFAELDPDQPASAIVNFVTKIMIGQSKIKS